MPSETTIQEKEVDGQTYYSTSIPVDLAEALGLTGGTKVAWGIESSTKLSIDKNTDQ